MIADPSTSPGVMHIRCEDIVQKDTPDAVIMNIFENNIIWLSRLVSVSTDEEANLVRKLVHSGGFWELCLMVSRSLGHWSC